MSARADFTWIPINQVFTTNNPTTTVEFEIEAEAEMGEVVDDGYLLVQAQGVSTRSHKIFVNGTPLPGVDLPSQPGWQTWLDKIPAGLLHFGSNTLRIDRIGNDRFRVNAVVVNWRENRFHRAGVRSDFSWVSIDERFTVTNPTTTAEFEIGGEPLGGGEPIDDAYVLIDYDGVSSKSHRVFINNEPLPGIDMPTHEPGPATWVDRIPPRLLHKGQNTIRIDRIGHDDFSVAGASINWRETTSTGFITDVNHADFNWVPVDHAFTNTSPTTTVRFPIAGPSIRSDDGYVLIQGHGISSNDHRVFINNTELPSGGLPTGKRWKMRMKLLPGGLLHTGTNTLRIDRIGTDNFRVGGVTVNWRV